MERVRGATTVPTAVREKYRELREKLALPLSLKRIGGHYYLYKQVTMWDREKKKYVCSETSYLGRIREDGSFVAKALRGPDDLDSARAVIASYGGKVVLAEKGGAEEPVPLVGVRLTDSDKQILMSLTMDARMRQAELAKEVGISTRRLGYRKSSLERRLSLEYVPYIKINKLGYTWFIVFVKFIEGRTDPERLREGLAAVPNVQLGALTTNGRYDMLLIVAAENDADFAVVLDSIHAIKAFEHVKAEWYISYLFVTKGFIPLRNGFFDLLEKRVWRKRTEETEYSQWRLSGVEYATLKSMNRDGAVQLASIERESGMSAGSAGYAYDKLKSRKIIEMVSMSMPYPGVRYNAAIVMEIIDVSEFNSTQVELMKFITDEEAGFVTNRFCLVGDIGMPNGGLFIMPVMRDGDLEKVQAEMARRVKGIRTHSFIITDLLCGRYVYGRFDNTKSVQHGIIEEATHRI